MRASEVAHAYAREGNAPPSHAGCGLGGLDDIANACAHQHPFLAQLARVQPWAGPHAATCAVLLACVVC